jgi:hypothetical protein
MLPNEVKHGLTDPTSKDLPTVVVIHRFLPLGTRQFSDLYINGKFFCNTAEPFIDGQVKLIRGVYKCVRGMHKGSHGMYYTYEVLNVPNHTGILFHPGNDPLVDSDGCILLGDLNREILTRSRDTFLDFLLRVPKDEFILTVI